MGRTAAEALLRRAACAHPETWMPTYAWPVTDSPTAIVKVDFGAGSEPLEVWDYPACPQKKQFVAAKIFPMMPKPMPPQSLCDLEDDIYATARAAAYVEL